jgi:hypothetical protein
LWVGDAGQSKAEEDGDSEAGPSRPQPPPETAASQHRAEWLASLHEGSQLCVRVQGAWRKATHQGAGLLLQGKDKEKVHLLVVDGFPNRYACRDERRFGRSSLRIRRDTHVSTLFVSMSLMDHNVSFMYIARRHMYRESLGSISLDGPLHTRYLVYRARIHVS